MAGVTVGTASYLENKADGTLDYTTSQVLGPADDDVLTFLVLRAERIAQFKGYFGGITEKINTTYASVQEGINGFEFQLPELQVPNFIKNILVASSPKDSPLKDSEPNSQQHQDESRNLSTIL